jgi:alanine racemase
VAAVQEGIELRNGGITDQILLFSQPHPDEIEPLISANLTPFVSDIEFAELLNDQALKSKTRLPIHLKIDTGMGRLGCAAQEALSLARYAASCNALFIEGAATHLAVSDSANPQDIEYTRGQIALFQEAVAAIRSAGIEPGIIHAANSGAVILHPEAWFDMVRPGISLYGYKLVDENKVPDFPFTPLQVEPVMELRSKVVMIKKINKGSAVSYGRTWIAQEDTFIGVLPIGYADGLPRIVSGKWQVVIGGNRYQIAGRICMDQCMVDLGCNVSVKRWDEAVIFGGAAPSAAALAELAGTIPYEITCNINKRVPRIFC